MIVEPEGNARLALAAALWRSESDGCVVTERELRAGLGSERPPWKLFRGLMGQVARRDEAPGGRRCSCCSSARGSQRAFEVSGTGHSYTSSRRPAACVRVESGGDVVTAPQRGSSRCERQVFVANTLRARGNPVFGPCSGRFDVWFRIVGAAGTASTQRCTGARGGRVPAGAPAIWDEGGRAGRTDRGFLEPSGSVAVSPGDWEGGVWRAALPRRSRRR